MWCGAGRNQAAGGYLALAVVHCRPIDATWYSRLSGAARGVCATEVLPGSSRPTGLDVSTGCSQHSWSALQDDEQRVT
jgi:hypothetical protein